jgi:predicted lipoprotein with Yx(FWY)xxD motif
MHNRWLAAPGAAAAVAAVALLAACGSSGSSGSASGGSTPAAHSSSAAAGSGSGSSGSGSGGGATTTASATGLKVSKTSSGSVLTDAKGDTVYWFAIDTSKMSKCNGSCAKFWPPLIGKPTTASGTSLSGKWGTIKRADGQVQATYDGHPLYLFKGDTAPGQVHGNKVNADGGLWWAMTPTDAKLTAATAKAAPSKSSSGGGSGYGY